MRDRDAHPLHVYREIRAHLTEKGKDSDLAWILSRMAYMSENYTPRPDGIDTRHDRNARVGFIMTRIMSDLRRNGLIP